MRYTSQDRLQNGAGLIARHRDHLPAFRDVSILRPIRDRWGTYDYWQLNKHRRRFQDIGTAPFLRLAQLIRAKMADAEVVNTRDVGPDVATGASRVSFALDAGRPQTRTLYHWAYPDHDRNRLAVGTYLGVTLTGLHVGQGMPLPDSEDMLGLVTILAVQGPADICAGLDD